ncbi:hypothetical protein XNC1_0791 [Xenorhabdus nematophila ATCC 19061]|uniref:Uncharacterized protein n=1 Tax=Xenorhabdus nematophila (strain ATCC 19061 / DSM 3370 / CCUG 14189 / LMG 1036 / NCIMB 9965 / AN6) TaxID=406817 RepID=D3VKB0_XENNA|nr:hypothetical protein XNC1_0791 [Xenorhabdus nematophila ATCC 19061]
MGTEIVRLLYQPHEAATRRMVNYFYYFNKSGYVIHIRYTVFYVTFL